MRSSQQRWWIHRELAWGCQRSCKRWRFLGLRALLGVVSDAIELVKEIGVRRTEIVVPAEPASVSGVNVHGNVGKVERFESISDTLTVAIRRVLAGLEVGVCDQVGERIGLDDKGNGGVGILLEDSNDGYDKISNFSLLLVPTKTLTVNVLGFVGGEAAHRKLSIGGLGSAITTRKIVNDQGGDLVTRNVFDTILDDGDLVTGVAIQHVSL